MTHITQFYKALLLVLLVTAVLSACAQRPVAEPVSEPEQVSEAEPLIAGAMSEAELLAEPIRFYLNLPYAGNDNSRQQLDIYVPERPSYVPMPVVIYLHGGLWQEGDKAEAPGRLLSLVTSGDYALVSVGYRLTDEAQWPAQLHDVKAAIRWVRARADDYGMDPQRIAVWGRDAGGQLALMSGMTNHAQDMAGHLGPYNHIRSDVAAVVNYSGMSDLNALLEQESSIDRAAGNAPEARLVGGNLRDNSDIASAASAIHYIRSAAPPVFTAHGTEDDIVPYQQARRLHQRLEEAEVESFMVSLLGTGHGSAQHQQVPAAWTEADKRARQFLDRVLLGRNQQVDISSIE